MDDAQRGKGRRQFLLIALLFLGPLVLASWLYLSGIWQPEGRVNNGTLIEPPRTVSAQGLSWLVEPPAGAVFSERWSLVQVFPDGCDGDCRRALEDTRAVWLRVGRDAVRIQRIALMPELPAGLRADHPDLLVADSADAAGRVLHAVLTAHGAAGPQVLIVDPNGNLILRYDEGYELAGLLADLKRLLRTSRVG